MKWLSNQTQKTKHINLNIIFPGWHAYCLSHLPGGENIWVVHHCNVCSRRLTEPWTVIYIINIYLFPKTCTEGISRNNELPLYMLKGLVHPEIIIASSCPAFQITWYFGYISSIRVGNGGTSTSTRVCSEDKIGC